MRLQARQVVPLMANAASRDSKIVAKLGALSLKRKKLQSMAVGHGLHRIVQTILENRHVCFVEMYKYDSHSRT